MKRLVFLLVSVILFACGGKKGSLPSAPEPQPSAKDSVEIIKKAILNDSLNPALWETLYNAQLAKGDTMAALGAISMYTQLVPENGDAWLTMAWLLADRKDARVLEIADSLQKTPDPRIQSTAKYLTGVYYSNLGNYDKAIAIFDSVILNNYTFIDAYMEKGIIQYNTKKYADALKTFQQAFLIRKNDPEIFLWIAKSYEGLGNKAEAEDWKKKYEALK